MAGIARQKATVAGITVVDQSTVVATATVSGYQHHKAMLSKPPTQIFPYPSQPIASTYSSEAFMSLYIRDGESFIKNHTMQCTMSPQSSRSCLKLNKIRLILNCQFFHAISKKICLNVFESKQTREVLVFVILKL